MKYKASISDFFKSPKWGTSMLLGAVTLFIPMVGPLVLSGWLITLFWARGDDNDPANYPPFNFDKFVNYLERGLWPFLVSLVASIVLVPVMIVLMGVPIASSVILGSGDGHARAFPFMFFVSMFMIYPVIMMGFYFLITPLLVRATITQDFAPAFNFRFMRRFFALVSKELLITVIFIGALGIAWMVLTVLTCYVGGVLLSPVYVFSWYHLQKQLYQLYVARGGEVVPLSPKLSDLPPPLPRP